MFDLFNTSGRHSERLDRLAENSHRRSMESRQQMLELYKVGNENKNRVRIIELEQRLDRVEKWIGLQADDLTRRVSRDVVETGPDRRCEREPYRCVYCGECGSFNNKEGTD